MESIKIINSSMYGSFNPYLTSWNITIHKRLPRKLKKRMKKRTRLISQEWLRHNTKIN